MKKLSVILASMLLLVGCQKKVNLKAEWEGVYQRATSAFEQVSTPDEAEAIMQNLIDSAYILLEENMGAEYSDSLFADMYYMFSPEQKEALFGRMNRKMLESETIAPIHKVFLLEQATSANNPYTDILALTPEGDELSLSALVGESDYVLLDFWASWCGPCRRLIPVLKEIYAGQPKGRFQILSCSVDRDEDAWRKALKEEQMPWPQVREEEGIYECSDQYGVTAIPTTILINREGVIIARNPDESELEELLFSE